MIQTLRDASSPALPSPLGGQLGAATRESLDRASCFEEEKWGGTGGGDTVRGVEMGMRRRGAAAGLGSEVPSPPSCTRAASPSPRRARMECGDRGTGKGAWNIVSLLSAVTKKFDVNNYVFTTPPCSDYGHTTQCCCLECCCLRVQCTTAQPRTSIPITVSSPRVRGCSASGPRASLCTVRLRAGAAACKPELYREGIENEHVRSAQRQPAA